MPTASADPTTSARYSAIAARFRMMATEADIQALIAIRTDPDKIHRTEDVYRSLICRQARYRRHVSNLEKQIRTGEKAQ